MNLEPIDNKIWISIRNSVDNTVRNSVNKSAWNHVSFFVWISVADSVLNSVQNELQIPIRQERKKKMNLEPVEDKIWESVWNFGNFEWGYSVGISVYNVYNYVENSVGNSVWNSVDFRLQDLIRQERGR
jgi:hypothetical protein